MKRTRLWHSLASVSAALPFDHCLTEFKLSSIWHVLVAKSCLGAFQSCSAVEA
ncbi:hypothetical protein XENTR_v10002535 [Xenopus tropicalis]|nr:hypothetical protein XENTR_v10002535 [Xenopus tropicalis]